MQGSRIQDCTKRGGTSRENKLFNNIFYNCGEAAIILPNEHNEIDGNVYMNMPPVISGIVSRTCMSDLETWRNSAAI